MSPCVYVSLRVCTHACLCVSLSLSPMCVCVSFVRVCVRVPLSLSLSLPLAQAPALSAAGVRPSCLLRESSACHEALHAAPTTHSLYTPCRSSFPALTHFVLAPTNPARQHWTQDFRRDRRIHCAPPNEYQHARVLHRKTLEDLVNLLRREIVFVLQPFLPGRVRTANSYAQGMCEAISKIPAK